MAPLQQNHSRRRRRILFLDAYDSFSNNITALLATELGVDVFVLPIDSPLVDPASPTFRSDLSRELSHYDAVVCGPGPGSPENELDVGLMDHVWSLAEEDLLPVLGICLGFQSLVAAFGGRIRRLRRGLHGMVRRVDHRSGDVVEGDIFAGVEEFKATLYHSLCADVGQDAVLQSTWQTGRWSPLPACPEIVPLAWVEEERDGDLAERILMAVKHRSKPLWGLQYHPESVCTDEEGHKVVRNWFREATAWNEARGRTVKLGEPLLARNATWPSLLSTVSERREKMNGHYDTHKGDWLSSGQNCRFYSRTIALPSHLQAPDIVEMLGAEAQEHIILDSTNASLASTVKTGADVRGKYSIIAMDVSQALRIEYHTGDQFATVSLPAGGGLEKVSIPKDGSIWQLLAEFHESRRISYTDPAESPFLGGFMGYVTYEQGLAGIGVRLAEDRGHRRPDVCLVWVTRSIVIDHANGVLRVQELRPPSCHRQNWIDTTTAKLESSLLWNSPNCINSRETAVSQQSPKNLIQTPVAEDYEAKVRLCQEHIAAGDSYELCLTDQTTIVRPCRGSTTVAPSQLNGLGKGFKTTKSTDNSWDLYRALRTKQPAPFASYIRLGPATLISSSPERFLQYDREGLCSMKPMKGTVRKSDAVSTLEQAEQILHVPKEEAENLMIVDLVRHDLHGICGAGNVSVPHLMKVEEYQSVFQMITVVEGHLPKAEPGREQSRHTGLDVLAASLPPGSMTGAPKKRSCEILQEIEDHRERSLYSGVVGYMCVSGRGDWSVTIRSMFRWDDEVSGDDDTEVWRVGAGGAVTILSTPDGEREEMFTKLGGPLSIFS